MRLREHDGEYMILVDGGPLMSSRTHGSEEDLAAAGCGRLRGANRPQVLVGGLGMGFTLRAALDLLPASAAVTVAELIPAVVEWNRGPLAALADHPLDDVRVRVEATDVGLILPANPGRFDAILLDVDNGPAAFTSAENGRLYSDAGVAASYKALRDGGRLAVWSAWDDRKFEQRLQRAGFQTECRKARAHKGKGAKHSIIVGVKQPRRPRPR